MSMTTPVDIASAEFKANPYPIFAQMRADAPVFRVKGMAGQEAWLITRYDDVAAALKDERLVKDRSNALTTEQARKQPWIPGVFKPLMRGLLTIDPPDHTRLRGLVHKAFTPRLIEQLRERVQAVTDELLDVAEQRGQLDLISDYALPLPTTIIAELLGVPPADRNKFQHWSKDIIGAGSGGLSAMKAIPSVLAFMRYIRRLLKLRRATPQDDLISALAQAQEADDQLSEDEVVSMIVLLLTAGHETTVNLIGNGTLTLLQHPEQLAQLRDNPSLIKTAVEELLRYRGPLITATERYAREDMEIAGVAIPRGSMVYAGIASANRDERQFEQPDNLDLTREPNRHLSFGQGIHYCLGAPLARLEGQIAINTLLQRTSDLRLAVPVETLRWRPGFVLQGMLSLPLTFKAVRNLAVTHLPPHMNKRRIPTMRPSLIPHTSPYQLRGVTISGV